MPFTDRQSRHRGRQAPLAQRERGLLMGRHRRQRMRRLPRMAPKRSKLHRRRQRKVNADPDPPNIPCHIACIRCCKHVMSSSCSHCRVLAVPGLTFADVTTPMLGICMQGTGVVTSAEVNLERPWLGCFAIVARTCLCVCSRQSPAPSIEHPRHSIPQRGGSYSRCEKPQQMRGRAEMAPGMAVSAGGAFLLSHKRPFLPSLVIV